MITEYKPFWDPFLKNEEFSLCRWKTKETTLAAAVPDLYETLGEETMWRAVVLYHGSAERGTNPFDFFSGEESAQEVEQNDLIRLTHMLSVVPRRVEVYPEPPQTGSAGRPETFQAAGISAIGAAQAAEGAAQAAAGNGTDTPGTAAGSAPSGSAPARAEYTDKDYILDTELHFVSRREDKDYYTLGDSNYEILCARPGKILLVATRKKDLSEKQIIHMLEREELKRGETIQPIKGDNFYTVVGDSPIAYDGIPQGAVLILDTIPEGIDPEYLALCIEGIISKAIL